MIRYLFICIQFSIIHSGFSQRPVIEFFGLPEAVTAVNTPFDENYLIQRLTDQSLVFARLKSPQNVNGFNNPADLWTYRVSDSTAIALNIDQVNFNTPIGFSPIDGKFYYNSVRFEKGVFSGSIMTADWINGVLDNHQPLPIRYFKNKSPIQSGCISTDGLHLIIGAEGTSTFGVEDLYVLHLQPDGSWSSPRNLGGLINSPFQEITPFLAADNRTLFYATNGRKDGSGSFDLYYSVRLDDTWQQWTEPVNLGATVNTSGSETSFIFLPESEYAFFVSTTNSDGYGDIKRVKIKSEIEPREVVMATVATTPLSPARDQQLLIIVKDESNGQLIPAKLFLRSEIEDIDYKSPALIKKGERIDLSFTASYDGYLTKNETLTAQQINSTDTLSIFLTPLTIGTVVNLENVLFHRGTANLIEGSEAELEKVVQMMNDNPKLKILLKGHTDSQGDPMLNLELSQERVRVVSDFIIKKGIAFGRISGKGYGGNSPLVNNDTEENRSKNRRVEFEILEN